MEININEYIDYERLFNDLYFEQKDVLFENENNIGLYDELMDFVIQQEHKINNHEQFFEIIHEECLVDDNKFVIVFSIGFDDASESNPQSSTADYIIVYDRDISEFIICDYQQG